MSPQTLEAYKTATGVDIQKHIKQADDNFRSEKSVLVLLGITLVIFGAISFWWKDYQDYGCLILIAIGICAIPARWIIPRDSYTQESGDFVNATSQFLLPTKIPCRLSFEEQLRETLLKHARWLLDAEIAYQHAMESRVPPAEMISHASMLIQLRQELNGFVTRANQFGSAETIASLMKRVATDK